MEYFAKEDVTLPLDRTKHIIRKCTDKDFDSPVTSKVPDQNTASNRAILIHSTRP